MGKTHSFSPSRAVLVSMAVAIAIGTFLLSLPLFQNVPTKLIDVFFTATSCTCVTGLLSVPLENFNSFGVMVISVLMQIGGLGLITLTLFVMSLFFELGLGTQVMVGETLELDSWKNMHKILLSIISIACVIELIGAVVIFQTLKYQFPFKKAVLYSVFHAIASFCNAGISVFEGNMVPYDSAWSMLLITALLMCAGGIGFITWNELITRFNPFSQAKKKKSLSLQTRVIIHYYFFLVATGTVLFWFLERKNTFAGMSAAYQWLNAFFLSVSARGGGYMSVYPNDLQHASLFSIMISAFVGAAPGSTTSGIKLTTAAIVIATIRAAIVGKVVVNMRGRRVVIDQIYRAFALVLLSIFWIVVVTFCLLLTEKSWPFVDVFFETIAAYTTLGVSIGITPHLTFFGKILIILSMFMGRVGCLTLFVALQKTFDSSEYSYPEERIMLT